MTKAQRIAAHWRLWRRAERYAGKVAPDSRGYGPHLRADIASAWKRGYEAAQRDARRRAR